MRLRPRKRDRNTVGVRDEDFEENWSLAVEDDSTDLSQIFEQNIDQNVFQNVGPNSDPNMEQSDLTNRQL